MPRSWVVPGALLVVAAAALAKYGDRLGAWLSPPPPPKPFVFDNGTVREPPVVSPRPLAGQTGTLKRCEKNGVVTYTDQPCAPGAKAKPVGGSMSVVDAYPAPAAPAPSAAGGAQQQLRRALDVEGPTLRDRSATAAADR